jgi:hypothetical protein
MLAKPQARVFSGLEVIFGLCGELDGLVNQREPTAGLPLAAVAAVERRGEVPW